MRKVTLIANAICLGCVYLFATGALNLAIGAPEYGEQVAVRLLAPLQGMNPLAISVASAGVIFFLASALMSREDLRQRRECMLHLSWSGIFNMAFLLNGLLVAWIVAMLILDSATPHPARTSGALFAAGVWEAVVGAVLATAILVFRRPGLLFLPALAFYLLGTTALGTVYYLGAGTAP